MKIKACRGYNGVHLATIKADVEKFKNRYTDKELLEKFADVANYDDLFYADIISANVEACPGETFGDNYTVFSVSILCKGYHEYIEIHYFCNIHLDIDLNEQNYSILNYKLRK